MQGAIGVFDSGFGGLTILREFTAKLPQYDYIYLGDNSRSPYGNRSFETVYHYTLQAVQWFFQQGCPLVILACNTASAKALRTIQQNDLQRLAPGNRVLGVIRPTTEIVGQYSKSKKVGVLATSGTVQSNSYVIEVNKFYPDIEVIQEACPMWVPLVENNEHESPGADYFIKKHIHQLLKKEPRIDTILLGCTHYPLLLKKITEYTPVDITVLTQGGIVANSLADYLHRHPAMTQRLGKNGSRLFFTTDDAAAFNHQATIFYGQHVTAAHVDLA